MNFSKLKHKKIFISLFVIFLAIYLYSNKSYSLYELKYVEKLDLQKEMVLFCAGGLRSALAAKSLKEMGFEKVSHIDGGFGAIKQSKFKII